MKLFGWNARIEETDPTQHRWIWKPQLFFDYGYFEVVFGWFVFSLIKLDKHVQAWHTNYPNMKYDLSSISGTIVKHRDSMLPPDRQVFVLRRPEDD